MHRLPFNKILPIGQEGSFAVFHSMAELGNINDINLEPMNYGAGGAGPGFSRDEPLSRRGEKLMLPAWFEQQREAIEANLEPIQVRLLEGDQE